MTYGHATALIGAVETAAAEVGGELAEQRAARIAAEREEEMAAVIARAETVFRDSIGCLLEAMGLDAPAPRWMGFAAGDPDRAQDELAREWNTAHTGRAGAVAELDGESGPLWLEFLTERDSLTGRESWTLQVAAACVGCGGMRYFDAATLDRLGSAIRTLNSGVPCTGACLPSEHGPAWQGANRITAVRLASVPVRPDRVTLADYSWVMDLLTWDRVVAETITGLSVSVLGNRAHVSVLADLDELPGGVRPAVRVAALLGLDEPAPAPDGQVETDEDGGRWVRHEFTRTLTTRTGSVCVTVSGREAI